MEKVRPVYAEVAIHTPVRNTFTYHIPDHLAGKIEVGHLVRVAFGTAMQPGIVVLLSDWTDLPQTKPIEARLDPTPVVTTEQIILSEYLAEMTLAPIGFCLWLWLPPGLTGHSDLRLTVKDADARPDDPLQAQIVALVQRRGAIRYRQMKQALQTEHLEPAVRALVAAGVLNAEPVLSPPAVRPQVVQTAALAIHPASIREVTRFLGKKSARADLLEAVADLTRVHPEARVMDVLTSAGSSKSTLKKLADEDRLVELEHDYVRLAVPREEVEDTLIALRKAETDLRVLRMLAREADPVDVSWVYAQTGAKLADLKRLADLELILTGEKHTWRDSLAERDFVPVTPPKLTRGQAAVWARIEAAFRRQIADPSPSLPVNGEGGEPDRAQTRRLPTLPAAAGRDSRKPVHREREGGVWYSSLNLWAGLKELAREKRHDPTLPEKLLWEQLRNRQLDGAVFRRQHSIDRFIVDFYCSQARLIIEVDGEIHQYAVEEDILRQAFLESLGFTVIRFTNAEVFHELPLVLTRIQAELQRLRPLNEETLPAAGESPSPFTGRDGEGSTFLRHGVTGSDRAELQRLQPFNDETLPAAGESPSPFTGRDGEGSTFLRHGVTGSNQAELQRLQPFNDETLPAAGESPSPFTGRDGEGSAFLLHGVTGSGKTEIYLRAMQAALRQGRQAILLVPEIALTAQTIRRVAARFPGQVALLHSRLGPGELYDTWRRCREGLVQVVVGTRSALFAPLPDVGCICIDEEHDDSYKNLASPHYDTREVAELMTRRNRGVLILGSATPDMVTFSRAQDPDDVLEYLHLPDRIMGHRTRITAQAEREGLPVRYQPEMDADGIDEALTINLPPVHLIDMRDELKAGNTSMFSRRLSDALRQTLARREQAILLLNRRGASTYVFCRDCGYVLHCPRCDMPLTFHQYSTSLRCHHCGYEGQQPTTCPNCNSTRIKFFGAGTQQVEAEVARLFPQARVVRWDSDTARNAEMHDAILSRFLEHQADVMVGTQLVAKGLDLPRVTLVGVISADTGLNLPDFRAGERTFQLLTQVAGRAGRGILGGQVILQSYQPENYAIRAAAKHDYAGFYAQELQYRREMGYPPFRRFARILIQQPNEAKARGEAQRVAELLTTRINDLNLTGTEIIGPAPCFFGRLNEQYRWHVLVRSPHPEALLADLDSGRGWHIELDPVDVL